MRLSGMVCPHCGGALGNIEEGRTQLFCTYCGSKLSLEIDNEEVKKITEFKNAEANLNYSKANYAEQRARQLEAETHKIMYRDSSNHIYSSKIAGLLLFIIGLIVSFLDLVFLFSSHITFDIEHVFNFYIFMLIGMCGVGAILLGLAKYNTPVGAERVRLENDLYEYKENLKKLEKEREDIQNIINENSGAIFGKKGSIKRDAKKRLSEITEEITNLNHKIFSLESKLSGNDL